MRMLRWMRSKTGKGRIIKEYVHELVGVTPTRENRLRWFGHDKFRPIHTAVRKGELIIVKSNARGRCKPKLTSGDIVRKDMSVWSHGRYHV